MRKHNETHILLHVVSHEGQVWILGSNGLFYIHNKETASFVILGKKVGFVRLLCTTSNVKGLEGNGKCLPEPQTQISYPNGNAPVKHFQFHCKNSVTSAK